MISTLQTTPAFALDKALTGQQARAFYRSVLAFTKMIVLLTAHLLGLTATALQALSEYYKEECHEGLLRWAWSKPDTETEEKAESADITVAERAGAAKTKAVSQLASSATAIQVSYKGFNSKMLRQLCEEFGVQWRDVHGKGKHLKMQEMKTRIDQTALARGQS